MISDVTFFYSVENQTAYIKKGYIFVIMYFWCILLSLVCYANASCAPVKNNHYHLTSIHDRNTTRTCVWDLKPGIVYLELERYSGRFGHSDKFAHMNVTLDSSDHVVTIANGEVRFGDQKCIVETTTRLEFQFWIALIFHPERVTVKVLPPGTYGTFVECFTFYHVKKEPSLTVAAYTELGMEQVVRQLSRRPPKSVYSTPSDSTKKSFHDLDRRLSDLERDVDIQFDMSDKSASEVGLLLKKVRSDAASAVAISVGNRDQLSVHFNALVFIVVLIVILMGMWLKINVIRISKKD